MAPSYPRLAAPHALGRAERVITSTKQAHNGGELRALSLSPLKTHASWSDFYVPAGVTAPQLVDLISKRGESIVRRSQMCVSLLRRTSQGGGSEALSGVRKHVGGAMAVKGTVQMEAIQLASPDGTLEDWRVRVPCERRGDGAVVAGSVIGSWGWWGRPARDCGRGDM